jgi:NADH dehydrogenase
VEDTTVLLMDRDQFLGLAGAIPPFRQYFEDHLAREGLDWPPELGQRKDTAG